jgi:hypothetical protein
LSAVDKLEDIKMEKSELVNFIEGQKIQLPKDKQGSTNH